MDALKKHREIVKRLCRVCGLDIFSSQGKKKYSKFQFYEEFGELFGIELNFDNDEVHPDFVCAKDANVFYRYKEAKVKQKSYTTDMVPVTFLSHSKRDCIVCEGKMNHTAKSSSKRGRPPKRKIGVAKLIHKQGQKSDLNNEAQQSTFFVDSFVSRYCEHTLVDIKCVFCIVRLFCQLIKGEPSEDIKQLALTVLIKSLEYSDLSSLAYIMGKAESGSLRSDSASFNLMYKDIKTISQFSVADWLMERNPVVTSFLCGIGNLERNINELQTDKVVALTSTVENTYKLCTYNLVCPFAFLQNISIYSLTGSRSAVDILARARPSGAYKVILSWLSEQTHQEPIIPDGDLFHVFDNEQVIGHRGTIKPKNKSKVSIITNKGYIQINPHGTLQKNEALKPPQILKIKEIQIGTKTVSQVRFQELVEDVIDQKSELYASYEALHYEQLYYFVDLSLKQVFEEQRQENNEISDDVDDQIKMIEMDKYTKCAHCGTLNTRRKQICIGCNEREGIKRGKEKDQMPVHAEHTNSKSFRKIEFEIDSKQNINIKQSTDVQPHERYNHIVTNHKTRKEIVLTDPVFCNPNSFETVANVLRQIGLENGITKYGGNNRHWTFICCDGVPYMICKKLKEEAVVCLVENCSKKFLNKRDYSNHMKKSHWQCEDWKFSYEFDWFYLRIGAGHYEMNLIPAFFELNWVPFLEKLCEEMGFISDAAKLYAKNCKDHHKSWNLLLIFHFAGLRELVLPYIRTCISTNKQNINAKDFFSFAHTIYQQRPNYKYLMDQICRMSQGIINFRMAIRRNNSMLMHSAKYMTKELFYARSHPKYQQIELYDHLQYLVMSQEVKEFTDSHVSITTSGNVSSGEDFDFVLEEKNRQLKQWISKGVPTDEFWLKICRNNIVLEQIKQNTYKQLGIRTSISALKDLDIEAAVGAFRLVLRKCDYLGSKNAQHVSITGQALDEELINYIDKSSMKRIYALKNVILQEEMEDIPSMGQPVPVTSDERRKLDDIRSMTKIQIEKQIMQLLEKITSAEVQNYHLTYFQERVKGKLKADYISFYNELVQLLSIENVVNDVNESDDTIDTEISETQLYTAVPIEDLTQNEAAEVQNLVNDLFSS